MCLSLHVPSLDSLDLFCLVIFVFGVPSRSCLSIYLDAKVWDDAGTEGRAGSIWMVNSLHLMAAVVGHEPPQGPFWDMKVRRVRMHRCIYVGTPQ